MKTKRRSQELLHKMDGYCRAFPPKAKPPPLAQ